MANQKVILIDAHAIIHRVYHALPSLKTSSGQPIQAVYGFTKVLLRVIKSLKPDYLAIAFDSRAPTFRHLSYKEYKSNRPPAPDDLKVQFPLVREIVKDFSLPVFALEGYEADDIIGTLVKKFESKLKEAEIFVVTGDWDAAQLITSQVKMYILKNKIEESVIVGREEVKNRYHLLPKQIVDFKALKGDPSDNIPGVKGIGEKTAQSLLQKYHDLDNLYKNLNQLEKKYQDKLIQDRDNAYLSRQLATIDLQVPLNFKLETCSWKNWEREKVRTVLDKFEFHSLEKSFFNEKKKHIEKKKDKKENGQLSLV